jgi:hypothetical protein
MKRKLLALAVVLAMVAAMIVPVAVSAAPPLYVATGGNDSTGTGTSALPFLTIGKAVSVAAPGDTIDVAAGTYTETTAQILISKNLTIVGAGAATTILKPSADTGAAGHTASLANGWFAVSPSFTFNLSNVTLDGTGHSIGAGVLYDQASGTVNNCTLENIQTLPSSTALGMGIAAYNGGVDNTSASAITNVNVTNCTFSNIGRIGIYFYAATGELTGTISGNKYTGKGVGTWLDYFVDIEGGTVTINNNTVTACLGVASDGSTSAGINVATYRNLGTTATITGNTVSDCSYGINVGIPNEVNSTGTSDYSTVIAHNNNLAGNTHGFASLTLTSAPVDATNNWWGTAVQSAIAPLIDGPVTYNPWAGAPLVMNNSATSNVTGKLVTLSSIAITPIGPLTLQAVTNQTAQFTATGTYSDGLTAAITTGLTWNSSAPTYASITSGGLVTPLASGATNITATLGTITSNTVVVNAVGSPNTLTLSVPSILPLGTLNAGAWNVKDWGSSNLGAVTETPGTDGSSPSWTVNAKGAGYMTSTSPIGQLTDPLLISPSNGGWSCADGSSPGTIHGTTFGAPSNPAEYSVSGSASGTFDMYAAQYVETGDVAGTYGDTITFTVGFTP